MGVVTLPENGIIRQPGTAGSRPRPTLQGKRRTNPVTDDAHNVPRAACMPPLRMDQTRSQHKNNVVVCTPAGRMHAAPTMQGKHSPTHKRVAQASCGGVETPSYDLIFLGQFQRHGAVVAAQNIHQNIGAHNARGQPVADQKVVDAPARVALPRAEPHAPPAVHAGGVGV